jgi:hypothetical protein
MNTPQGFGLLSQLIASRDERRLVHLSNLFFFELDNFIKLTSELNKINKVTSQLDNWIGAI